jgi:hypothetical protein
MRIDVAGAFHNVDAGVKRGDIVDVDDASAARYIALGYAEPVDDHPGEEAAVLEPETESAVAKRRGRKKKPPEWDDENAPGWSEVEQQQ